MPRLSTSISSLGALLSAAVLLAGCPLGPPTVGGYPIVCQSTADCGPGTTCDFSQGQGLCLTPSDGGDAGDAGDGGNAGDGGDSGMPDGSVGCSADGTSCDFDGGNVCLGEACVSGCAVALNDGGMVVALAGAVDPVSGCSSCQPSQNATAYTGLPEGTPCTVDGGNFCQAATCVHGCALSADAGTIVVKSGALDRATGCASCQPDVDPHGYTELVDGTACDAGGGNLCQASQCVAACLIDGGIYASRLLDPSDPGRCCNLAVISEAWTPALAQAPGAALTTANPPLRIAAADLDGDGNLDLIVVEQGTTEQIEIFRGDGTGHFTSGSQIDTGAIAVDLAVGDFNADGFPDIAVLQANARVTLLINLDGGEAFDGSGSFASPTSPTAIVAANLYTDGGPPDLAVTGVVSTTDVVSVARNLSGAFGGSVLPYDVGSKPDAVCSGNFDGIDGTDLAVANSKDGTLSVLLNQGDGTLVTAGTVALGGSPTDVASVEESGPAEKLAVTISPVADAGSVAMVERLPDSGFAMTSSVLVGPSPSAIGAADFNGDSLSDLAVTDSSEAALRLLYATDGGYRVHSYTTGPDVALVVGDFNGDGRPDVAVASGDSKITLFLGQCP